jgi:hypothetical protein
MYKAWRWRVGGVMIEAGVVTGYVIAWAVRKAQRAAGRLDTEVDTAIEAGLDRLHKAVTAKLGTDPALAELERQADADEQAQVSPRTRTRVELALEDAAERDEDFARALTELVARLRATEEAAGRTVRQVAAGQGAVNLTGNVDLRGDHGAAVSLTMRDVTVRQTPPAPHQPDRPRD